MDVQYLKEYLLDNDLIENILEEIGCHNIKSHGDYITCANKDGDNNSAIVIYLNENLTTINYTRQMSKNKIATDIFDLICYNEKITFPESLKFICNLYGLDYYHSQDDIPESLQILQMLKSMQIDESNDDNIQLEPISENILKYYLPYGNILFKNDGISYYVQKEFQIGYDESTNRITIPIRSPIGDLCGVKGRLFGDPDEYTQKYIYIEPTSKSKLLYGFFENKNYIMNNNFLYIVESEKSVMQLASIGIRNSVATGGKTISKTQIELITRTGCTPIFAFDKDVKKEELIKISNMFLDGIKIEAIIDNDNILEEKESPSDNEDKWNYLIKNNIYIIRENKVKNESA